MADKLTYRVEVDDHTTGAIVGSLGLEIGSSKGFVFMRLVDANSMKMVGHMNVGQAKAMIEALQKAIGDIE